MYQKNFYNDFECYKEQKGQITIEMNENFFEKIDWDYQHIFILRKAKFCYNCSVMLILFRYFIELSKFFGGHYAYYKNEHN